MSRKFVNLFNHKKMKYSNIRHNNKITLGNLIMFYLSGITFLAFFLQLNEGAKAQNSHSALSPVTIVVHGGAGTIRKGDMTAAMEQAYREKLTEALDAGYGLLESGGSSIEAVIVAIKLLEDSPLFNAGKGSVFTHEGTNEMDASLMEGRSLQAGAVAGVTVVRNPITAARAVMENSPHVLLTGRGAEDFARLQGLEIVDPDYFYSKRRYRQLQNILDQEKDGSYNQEAVPGHKFGTVGVVALDERGNLAAGTSTGGMTNKKYGRVGDSPVIGAGTYADNRSCAVSSTGHGEYFIRKVVAYDIAAKMKYAGMSVEEAAVATIEGDLTRMGGTGGVICLDREGNVAMVFNTEGMYRGYRKKGEEANVFIYR